MYEYLKTGTVHNKDKKGKNYYLDILIHYSFELDFLYELHTVLLSKYPNSKENP
jgi:hypothetical protein